MWDMEHVIQGTGKNRCEPLRCIGKVEDECHQSSLSNEESLWMELFLPKDFLTRWFARVTRMLSFLQCRSIKYLIRIPYYLGFRAHLLNTGTCFCTGYYFTANGKRKGIISSGSVISNKFLGQNYLPLVTIVVYYVLLMNPQVDAPLGRNINHANDSKLNPLMKRFVERLPVCHQTNSPCQRSLCFPQSD